MKYLLNKIELNGSSVRLIPLSISHKEALLAAATDGNLWELWYTCIPSKDSIDAYVHKALEDMVSGKAFAFVVVNKSNNKIIGSTRYCFNHAQDETLEIGYTWYAKSYQRTSVNTECKYLLLKYAFERLDCTIVNFKTNSYNKKSRVAISRLGAKETIVLNTEKSNPDGTPQQKIIYSIFKKDWMNVSQFLQRKTSLSS